MIFSPRSRALAAGSVLLFSLTSARAHSPADDMSQAAANFLKALTPAQRAKAVYAFTNAERFDWHYIPRARNGLPFGEMSLPQRQLAQVLMLSALSPSGYTRATNIMNTVELVLRDLEHQSPRRDPGLYCVTIFGDPARPPWGWRLEGHHVSLNFAVADGELLAITPSFLGANPASVPSGPLQGFRALAAEEDLGRQLVKSLTEEQRRIAVIDVTAPGDIVTAASRKVTPLQPAGIAAARLDATQKDLLRSLLRQYLFRYRDEIAGDDLKKIEAAGFEKITFAWAGGLERGQKHYYRIQGPTFLMEYDNTQNDANHVHTVWRDFENDFGEDILRRHYEREHAGSF